MKKKIIAAAAAVTALLGIMTDLPGDPSCEVWTHETVDTFTIDTAENKFLDGIAADISDAAQTYSILCFTKGTDFAEGTYKIKINMLTSSKENSYYKRDGNELASYVNGHISARGYALICFRQSTLTAQTDVEQVFFSPTDIFSDDIADFDPSSAKLMLGAYPRICRGKPDGSAAVIPERTEEGFSEEDEERIARTFTEYEKNAFNVMNYAGIYMTRCQTEGDSLKDGVYYIDLYDKEKADREYKYDGTELVGYITENMRNDFGYCLVEVRNNEPIYAFYSEKDFDKDVSRKQIIIGSYPDKERTRITGIDYDKYSSEEAEQSAADGDSVSEDHP